MSEDKRRRIVGVIVALAIAALAELAAGGPVGAHPAPGIIGPVWEDSGAWDCAHMGNRTCGAGHAHADWYMV